VTGVHLAYTVMSALTTVPAVNSVPPPFFSVYQPPNTKPSFTGMPGRVTVPSSVVSAEVCAGVPPVRVKRYGVHGYFIQELFTCYRQTGGKNQNQNQKTPGGIPVFHRGNFFSGNRYLILAEYTTKPRNM
jgi:hypothetical protein